MRDWRGTEIKVGSTVLYPQTVSSSLWVTEAEVTSLKPFRVKRLRQITNYGVRAVDHKVVTLTALGRLTVLA